MPGLARKLLICAAADALVVHPIGARDERGGTIRIAYGDTQISTREPSDGEQNDKRTIESAGIIGLLNLVSSSYLITITKAEVVAKIRGSSVYAVRDVALIPLSSQEAATRTVLAVQAKRARPADATGDQTDFSDVGEDADTVSSGDGEHDEPGKRPEEAALEAPKNMTGSGKSSNLQSKSNYGKLASRWFSKGSSQAATSRKQQKRPKEDDLAGASELDEWRDSIEEDSESISRSQQTNMHDQPLSATASVQRPTAIESLTARILRSARLYFSAGGFYFSYDHDLSKCLGSKEVPSKQLPLWQRFNSLYFWNRNLLDPLVQAGCDDIVLPIMQGFVGQREFSMVKTPNPEGSSITSAEAHIVDEQHTSEQTERQDGSSQKFHLSLISRRSIKRAGLRYLRRGVDEEGNVANSVETEQILSSESGQSGQAIFSLLQIRGSIPLFFSQSPYSFKPLPMTFGSESTNQEAFRKHFDGLLERYGRIQVTSLVDKHGTEASIGESYMRNMEKFNESSHLGERNIGFEWFDFHSVCKGMKFENVSVLLNTLEESLRLFGWTALRGDEISQQQSGVLRTNCMDCLDRTNVTQSAIGGWVLQQQLSECGYEIDLQSDAKTQWFNTLWADNGDAISKQYAGTAALKGDFTRTRKRNWKGALSDFSLTLTRYYNNIFGDYFLQTEIDFFLGNAGPEIFTDFETDLMSKDYALDMRRIRHHAIDTCIKIVLEDPEEDFIGGWTLSCPHEANSIRSARFEECVLLLTASALYFCRFDWNTEKVGSFERISLDDIKEIWKGAYITSALGQVHLDETKNVGFVIRYDAGPQAVMRTNTRSLQNEHEVSTEDAGKNQLEKQTQPNKDGTRLLAFKALPHKDSAAKSKQGDVDDLNEQTLIERVCRDIHEAMSMVAQKQTHAEMGSSQSIPTIEHRDVLSAADAKKSTGYVESIGYSLKRLVWS